MVFAVIRHEPGRRMMARNTSELLEYADVSLSYRAPRVAIVINGDHEWIYLARLAIYAACEIWGGYGFVLVPYRGAGVVNPAILRAIRAYDPDYVVTLPITIGQFDAVFPGTIDAHVRNFESEGYEPAVIESLRSDLIRQQVPLREDGKARESVVAACSTYRMAMGDDTDVTEWTERTATLEANGTGLGPFTPVDRFRQRARPRFGAKSDLNTPLGLLAASVVGLVNEPTIDRAFVSASDEASLAFTLLDLGSPASIRSELSCFERIDTAKGGETQNAWVDSQTDLATVNDYRYNRVLYVVGNEPEDFCLSFLWQRLYGQSLWLADELWANGATPTWERNRQAIAHGMRNLTRRSSGIDPVMLTSVSKDSDGIEDFLDAISQTPQFIVMPSDLEILLKDRVQATAAEALPFPSRGKHFLGLQQQFHWTDTMPVIRDSEGGLTLAGTPPPPILKAPGLGDALVSHHIDLDILSVTMPQAKALPPAALVRSSDNPFERYDVWVRSSRRGVSYESLRHGFVQAGILHQETLGRPRVRKPGMLTWARWKARMSGYELQVSDAGWPAHILANMTGGRRVLAEAVSSALHPALLEYKKRPSGTKTSNIFDNDDGQKGCVLNGIVYLTILGFASLSGQAVTEVRKSIDQLMVGGVLTRGLVLRCTTCRVLSFYPIGVVGQSNTCPRCRNIEQLRHELWKDPEGEPDWFYDLHPLGRDLVGAHGEVPLLLATYLSKQVGNHYSDTPEVVLRRKGSTAVEADLIAVAEDTLLIAEAKSNDNLGVASAAEAKSVRLRLKLSEIFDADEIVFATTEDSWKARTLSTITSEVEAYEWPNGIKPRIRVVTSLAPGGRGVEDFF
jgi:hypothetical protein